jgi:hypothetical protein
MKTLLDMIKKLVDTDSTTTEYVDYLDDWYDFDVDVINYPKRRRYTNNNYKSTRYASDVVKNMRAIRKKTLGNVECARNVQKIKGRIMYGW